MIENEPHAEMLFTALVLKVLGALDDETPGFSEMLENGKAYLIELADEFAAGRLEYDEAKYLSDTNLEIEMYIEFREYMSSLFAELYPHKLN